MKEQTFAQPETVSQQTVETEINLQLTEDDKKKMRFVETSSLVIHEYFKDVLFTIPDERPRDESHYTALEERYRFLSMLFNELADYCNDLAEKGNLIEELFDNK